MQIEASNKAQSILQEYSDLPNVVIQMQEDLEMLKARPIQAKDTKTTVEGLQVVIEGLKAKIAQVDQRLQKKISQEALAPTNLSFSTFEHQFNQHRDRVLAVLENLNETQCQANSRLD